MKWPMIVMFCLVPSKSLALDTHEFRLVSTLDVTITPDRWNGETISLQEPVSVFVVDNEVRFVDEQVHLIFRVPKSEVKNIGQYEFECASVKDAIQIKCFSRIVLKKVSCKKDKPEPTYYRTVCNGSDAIVIPHRSKH